MSLRPHHQTILGPVVTEKTTELKVKARSTFLLPKIDIAQKVYNAILARLK